MKTTSLSEIYQVYLINLHSIFVKKTHVSIKNHRNSGVGVVWRCSVEGWEHSSVFISYCLKLTFHSILVHNRNFSWKTILCLDITISLRNVGKYDFLQNSTLISKNFKEFTHCSLTLSLSLTLIHAYECKRRLISHYSGLT